MSRLTSILFIVATAVPAAASAADIERGKKLHQKNCFGCHDTSVYTRPDRLIHSYGDLENRVRFCETQNGLAWNDRDISDVAAYLNANFYKFPKK